VGLTRGAQLTAGYTVNTYSRLELVGVRVVSGRFTGLFIALYRPDSAAVQQSYGLLLHDTRPTHQLGGTLDAVVSRADTGCPRLVDVVDVGLSDHHLLQWSVDTSRETPPTTVAHCRAWRRLDYEDFRSSLSSSRLCQPDDWPHDVDEMASVYDVELTRLLDQLIPARQVVRRPPSFRPLVRQRMSASEAPYTPTRASVRRSSTTRC